MSLARHQTPHQCFNPCCGGIPLRIFTFSDGSFCHLSFQSLLWWNTSENLEFVKSLLSAPIPFQSLLWWNTSENLEFVKSVLSAPIPFQSLLWWNTSENFWRRLTSAERVSLSFNPCCGGIPLRIAPSTLRGRRPSGVSILVVVEYL